MIEDDPEVAELLGNRPPQSGFRPIVTPDGLTGVEAVRTHRPVVVTVDIGLPGIDGFEVTRRIRAFSSTYVLMVSAQAGEDDILGGFEAGADDYVAKPFRPRELRARFIAGLRRPPERYRVARSHRSWSCCPAARPATRLVELDGDWSCPWPAADPAEGASWSTGGRSSCASSSARPPRADVVRRRAAAHGRRARASGCAARFTRPAARSAT